MDHKINPGAVGVIIWLIFCIPFALFGLYAMGQALQLARSPSAATPFWYPLIFGVVFSMIGFGLIFLLFIGKKKYGQQQRLEAEHQNEPWLWRADWAQGRVKSKTRGDMAVGWFLTIAFNAASLPAYRAVLHGHLPQMQPIAYVVLLFPAAGLFLLARSIRATLAFLKYGKTCFDMASVPGVMGRELKGAIEASFPQNPDHGVHLRLSCVHRVTTGSGRSRSTREYIVWRDEADLAPGQLCAGPMGATIPVAFHIPLDVHPTEKISSYEEYVWLLEALADMPGINYHDAFEIPVFRTAASPTPEEAAAMEGREFAVPAARPPEHLTVRSSDRPDGKEFYFPAARNPAAALATTLFAGMFSGITLLLAHLSAPILFPITFGIFSCPLIYSAARQWMGTSRVIIGSTLKVQSGVLGGGRVREIQFSDIDSIDDKITSQQGGATGTAYYDIVLRTRDGRSLALGTMLSSKREAEWLLSEFRKLTRLPPHAVGVGA